MDENTQTNDSKATFRAAQAFRIEARPAGNGPALSKGRNAGPGRLGRSLRAGGWAAIRGVAPACHRKCYGGATAPCD